MLLFTLFSHPEEQRTVGCQQLSGTKRLPCSPAQPIQGLEQTGFHFMDTEHLYSDGKLCQQPVRRSWRREGRQDPPLVTACKPSLGGQSQELHVQLSLDAADRDRLMTSALISAFEL